MYDKLQSILNQHIRLTEDNWILVKDRFRPLPFKKKEKLLDIDQVAKHFYFINSGIMRLYGYKDGEEKTLFFFKENMIASSIDSFLDQSASSLVLEALTDMETLAISVENLQELYLLSPDMTRIGLLLTQYRLSYVMKLFSSFVLDSPEERYNSFMEEQPDLLLEIPHHIIASFLGITPVSLSRIRKRISR